MLQAGQIANDLKLGASRPPANCGCASAGPDGEPLRVPRSPPWPGNSAHRLVLAAAGSADARELSIPLAIERCAHPVGASAEAEYQGSVKHAGLRPRQFKITATGDRTSDLRMERGSELRVIATDAPPGSPPLGQP